MSQHMRVRVRVVQNMQVILLEGLGLGFYETLKFSHQKSRCLGTQSQQKLLRFQLMLQQFSFLQIYFFRKPLTDEIQNISFMRHLDYPTKSLDVSTQSLCYVQLVELFINYLQETIKTCYSFLSIQDLLYSFTILVPKLYLARNLPRTGLDQLGTRISFAVF